MYRFREDTHGSKKLFIVSSIRGFVKQMFRREGKVDFLTRLSLKKTNNNNKLTTEPYEIRGKAKKKAKLQLS